MVHRNLDAQRLYELGSHPGTFPEMIQSIYHAGFEAGKEEERKGRDEVIATRHCNERELGWFIEYVSIQNDISASKGAQQRLSEMADQLTLAIEGGSVGLWGWMDVNADAQWWSPSFYAMLGYQPSELTASLGSFTSLLHPSHLTPYRQVTEAALSGSKAFDMELLLRTQAGEYRWFRSRAKVYLDTAGRAARMAGSLQDIQDRKQAERDLGRERRRLGNILEGTNVGTWEWNIETGATQFNERWAQIIGRTLEELGATTIETWTGNTHPEDQSRSALLLEEHFNGGLPYYECETRVQHKDGHWVWVLDRGKLFSRSADGRPRWMAGTRIDITERRVLHEEAPRNQWRGHARS
jgi:two-component system, sensor histidine kinase and response regulator